ncbi:MAG: hypothetical protein JJT89_02425 [Nitriliruptoraceae bacterium]|nr:hypothetical protein [Nitriliruptoraceae bacterium]
MPSNPRVCHAVQEDLSAAADAEEQLLPSVELDRHLAVCASCQGFRDGLEAVTRRVRVGVADEVPDLTASVLVALADDRAVSRDRRTLELRWLVALAGAVQLVLAVPALVGMVGPDLHLGRDLAALQLALGVGFLVAAWQPSRTPGLVPVAVVVALVAVVTGSLDVLSGAATLTGELTHLAEIVGVAALIALRRRIPSGPLPLRAGAEPV